jgi:hypothetical protein
MHDDPNKRPALIVASVASFLMPFMGSSVNIALPVVARDFAMDAVTELGRHFVLVVRRYVSRLRNLPLPLPTQ